MPKVDIDYSNTLFYKIYCIDPSINDMYIGHTTNFVQRKHAHKQGCKNTRSSNYNCKLYNFIRANKGWDNWNMEIIAFHNCDDHLSARKIEQKYFEDYNATLNSIAPLPPPKQKPVLQPKKEKEILYCNTCKVYFSSHKLQEIHNKSNKHIKLTNNSGLTQFDNTEYAKRANKTTKFLCKLCDFSSNKHSDYTRHINTKKHIMVMNGNTDNVNNNSLCAKNTLIHTCSKCNTTYKHASGLSRHKKTCTYKHENNVITINNDQHITSIVDKKEDMPDMKELIITLMTQNQSMQKQIFELQQQMFEQQQQILKLIPQSENTTNNV